MRIFKPGTPVKFNHPSIKDEREGVTGHVISERNPDGRYQVTFNHKPFTCHEDWLTEVLETKGVINDNQEKKAAEAANQGSGIDEQQESNQAEQPRADSNEPSAQSESTIEQTKDCAVSEDSGIEALTFSVSGEKVAKIRYIMTKLVAPHYGLTIQELTF